MASPRAPRVLWLLALITATMPFWDLGHPLWEVDDARYAEVPREMVESGDWLTPHLNYIDYLQKPPLIYWLDAASYRAFGVSEASSRVPLALFAVLGLAGTAWLGAWLFSLSTGLAAAVLLGTCAEYSCLSHLQTPDMALSVSLLWASALVLRALRRPEDGRWAWPAAGACMGIAFLSKGLVGVVFPLGWATLLAALFPDLRRGIRPAPLAAAACAALAVSVPWLWAMARRHPGFLYHFFIEHHVIRYLTPEFQRTGPWYYFIAVDLGGMLPWTPAAAVSLAAAARGGGKSDAASRQLALWVLLILAFFSASKSKLPTYILPIFPHQCLLAAEFLRRLGSAEREAGAPDGSPAPAAPWERLWLRRISWTLASLVLGAIPVAFLLWPRFGDPQGLPRAALWTGGAALAALGAALAFGATAALRETAASGSGASVGLARGASAAFALTALLLLGARRLGPFLSAKEISGEILSAWRPGDAMMTYDFYLHGLPFYTGRPVGTIVNWFGEFRPAEYDPRYKGRFGNDETIRALPTRGGACFVAVRRRMAPYMLSLAGAGKARSVKTFGDVELAVF